MNPQTNSKVCSVTCLNCKGVSRIRFFEDGSNTIMYIDHTPIIACRFRGDLKWGFECMCGNDSRLARQEKDDADLLLQSGDSNALKRLVATLKVSDENKFLVEIA